MPVSPTYPGVYIEEIPSGVRTITGVATSITAFIGRTRRGPVDEPIRIQNFPEFERRFGGLWVESMFGYAVYQFFLNGGTDAIIVRVHNSAVAATVTLPGSLNLIAANPGIWGESLRVRVDHNTRPLEPGEAADIIIRHTTLVPGWEINADSCPLESTMASLKLLVSHLCVKIEHSIIGSIEVDPAFKALVEIDDSKLDAAAEKEALQSRCRSIEKEVRLDPIRICISDSILDATDPELEAIGTPDCSGRVTAPIRRHAPKLSGRSK